MISLTLMIKWPTSSVTHAMYIKVHEFSNTSVWAWLMYIKFKEYQCEMFFRELVPLHTYVICKYMCNYWFEFVTIYMHVASQFLIKLHK